MREDHFTNTPEDAGRYEAERANEWEAIQEDRPTLADLHQGDECACPWPNSATGLDTSDGPDKVWICDECGLVVNCEGTL